MDYGVGVVRAMISLYPEEQLVKNTPIPKNLLSGTDTLFSGSYKFR